jgi:hypothetical protein
MLKDGRIGKGEAVLKLTPAVRAEVENRAYNQGVNDAVELMLFDYAGMPDCTPEAKMMKQLLDNTIARMRKLQREVAD